MDDLWYQEINDYDFSTFKSKNGNPVGHFTQLVWDASNTLGCGLAANLTTKRFYGVARYTPTGNIQNWYNDNVYPLLTTRVGRITNQIVRLEDSNCRY